MLAFKYYKRLKKNLKNKFTKNKILANFKKIFK